MSHVRNLTSKLCFFGIVISFVTFHLGCTAKFDLGTDASKSFAGGAGGGNSAGGSIPTTAYQDRLYEYTVQFGAGYAYSLENAPSWLSIDSATGKLSGLPSEPGLSPGVVVIATKVGAGGAVRRSAPVDLVVLGDPLTRRAWHLGNSGQATFARNPGMAGEDMKVSLAIQSGYTGSAVKVGISDTGLQMRHPDLVDNASAALSKNYGGAAPYLGGDPSPVGAGGDHGTSVSGIVGAKGWNGLGARGIAPEAVISGFNYLPFQAIAGVDIDQAGGNYDVFNQSWGSGFDRAGAVFYTGISPIYLDQLRSTATLGRNGRGSIIVRAAGNDFRFSAVPGTTQFRQRPANGEEDNVHPWTIVVGALNARGTKASYSSTGSTLWISGLAGEFGTNDPAMLTTDVSGCDRGYSQTGAMANLFETGQLGNADCNYTTIFNGTSSASPSVAGVVALLLHANPNLSFRDVKHILARTATKVDADFRPTQFVLDPIGYFSEPGWITNAAGYPFHNWYGFGRANAKAGVDMAKGYVSQLGTLRETVDANRVWKYDRPVALTINDNNATTPTAVDTVSVTENWVIEAVQIQVSITHPFMGDIGIELTSPSGTKSVIFNTNNSFNRANLANAIMASNAFYGENSAGNWTLRVLDGAAGAGPGTLTNWKLNILGHTP